MATSWGGNEPTTEPSSSFPSSCRHEEARNPARQCSAANSAWRGGSANLRRKFTVTSLPSQQAWWGRRALSVLRGGSRAGRWELSNITGS
nr:hypothetical protein Itr_chr13CG14090 [Ipomoea trifida]GLL44750.1 hypothetical protein Itr_chr13CG14100 [Ipomoea trifida]